MKKFVTVDMKKDAPPQVRRHINIPDFMLTPTQLERKRKRTQLINDVSFYAAVFCGGWFVWFFLYIETNWKVSIIGMTAMAALIVLISRWRRAHGYGGDGNVMD